MSNIKYHNKTDFSAKLEAFRYQHDAFMALKDKPYAAIFHEQGLGKTKIAIDLLLYWLQKRDIDTVLIVTKKTLVNNWCSEFEVHTNTRPKTLGSRHGDNFYVLNSPVRVIITNFETISSEKERMKLFLQTRNVAIIIDESTKIKNPESKLTQDFFELSQLFKIRVIMTGTPVANRPYDMWAQIYFLDQGNSLGESFDVFKKECDLSNDLGNDTNRRNIFENSVASIYDKIKTFSVRETKSSGIISLPDKVYHNLYIAFENRQNEMYEEAVDWMSAASAMDPENGNPLYYLGKSYQSLERYKEALDAYNKTLEVDPNSTLKEMIEERISECRKKINSSN